MKLAEALAERSDCQKRLDEIKDRLNGSARIQEGEQPAEDPAELLSEADRIYARLLELIRSINRTNSQTAFDSEHAISDVLAEREVMNIEKKYAVLTDIQGMEDFSGDMDFKVAGTA